MMKRFLPGVLVCLLAFGFVFVTCDNGSDGGDPNTVKYESKDTAGNTYTLTITKGPRAAYTPAVGDIYVLIIKMIASQLTSKGTISALGANGVLTLQPNYDDSSTFEVTINGGKMTAIDGTIALEGGSSTNAPSGTLTPSGGSGGGGGGGTTTNVVGTWECEMTRKQFAEAGDMPEEMLKLFGVPEKFKFLELVLTANKTYTMYEYNPKTGQLSDGSDDLKTGESEKEYKGPETGTYTVVGNILTCTSDDGEEQPPFTVSGNKLTGTFPSSDTGKPVTITFTKKK